MFPLHLGGKSFATYKQKGPFSQVGGYLFATHSHRSVLEGPVGGPSAPEEKAEGAV